MKDAAEFGMNKTPTQLSPVMTQAMIDGYDEFPPHAEETGMDTFTMRKNYNQNAEQLGAVPLPSSVKGAVSTGLQAIKGNNPSILIDKLGERLAFERSGVRLYEALITKCQSVEPDLDIMKLKEFRDDEAEHFALVKNCITAIGGDPTAQTPCADSSGVAAMGLNQVITDPRSSIPQCVEAILTAELTDFAAWEMLIQLMNEADLNDYIESFQQAKETEDQHLKTIKSWLIRMTLKNEVLPVV